jgi:hypothetical protein
MQLPAGDFTTAQKNSRTTKMARENARFWDLVGNFEHP